MTVNKICDYFEDHTSDFPLSKNHAGYKEGIRLSYYKDHDWFFLNAVTVEIIDSYGTPSPEPLQSIITMTPKELDQFIYDLILFRYERNKHVDINTG